ncbi:MAG TPA: hypothetical protein VLI90_03065, partial [Tepidisphaeraceae bacterium]|nr:hypothetical protein [Tepidisphaeraceae bacterium]
HPIHEERPMRMTWLAGLLISLPLQSLLLAAAAPPATTEPTAALPPTTQAAKANDFLRFVDKGSTGSRLETADVAYRNADGATVHLVAAVHIGERDYFEGLNESFKLRDAVLYEMVKPKDQPAPEHGAESHSTISQMQRMIKDALGLEFQLDVIDYTRPNFVHADLDAETFERMQAERGESMTMLMVRQMLEQMANPPKDDANAPTSEMQLEDLIQVFTRPDGERQVKLLLAKNLAQLEEGGMGLDAMDGTVILTERNKAAISTLERTLKEGKRDVAVFYGAAHMPGLSKALVEMGFHPVAREWRRAWDLTIRADQPSAVENLLMNAAKGLDDLDK